MIKIALKIFGVSILWQAGSIGYAYLVTYHTPEGDSWLAFMLGLMSLAYFVLLAALMIFTFVEWWDEL